MPPAIPVSKAVSPRAEILSRTALVLLWSVMLCVKVNWCWFCCDLIMLGSGWGAVSRWLPCSCARNSRLQGRWTVGGRDLYLHLLILSLFVSQDASQVPLLERWSRTQMRVRVCSSGLGCFGVPSVTVGITVWRQMPLDLCRDQQKLHRATWLAQGENMILACGGWSGANQIGTNFARKPFLKFRNALDNSF